MLSEELFKHVERAIQGDKDAFRVVCDMKATDILYVAIQLMGNVPDGEDAAQEILLSMHDGIRTLREPNAFNVWLYRMIRNICINRLNKKNRVRELMTFEEEEMERMEDKGEFLPHDLLEDEKKKEALLKVVRELPFNCKVCVLMFYFDDLSYKEIEHALGIGIKDVSNAFVKFKRLFREELAKAAEQETRAGSYGSVAMVAKLLRDQVPEVVPAGAKDRFMDTCNRVLEGTFHADNGEQSTGAQSVRPLTKIALGVVITVTAAAGIMGIYMIRENKDQVYSSDEVRETSLREAGTAAEQQAELEIRTLEDMIGVDAAEQLRSYLEQNPDKEEIRDFLKAHGLDLAASIWIPDYQAENSLYKLVKQQKKLLVITREYIGGEKMEVVFRFTGIEEEEPLDIEIHYTFDAWQEAGE